jgi:hypothetical protein
MMSTKSAGDFAQEEAAEGYASADAALARTARSRPRREAAPKQKRLVVYTSNLKVRVARVESALSRVNAITKQYNGFIESSSTADYNASAQLRIRIPVDSFHDAVRDFSALGQLLEKNINAADITRQFQDTSLRLNSAKRLRARLYQLLKSNVSQKEKVKILKEISRLNEEIELLEGRIKAMRRKAALSTIVLRLESALNPARSPKTRSPFPWVTNLKPESRSISKTSPLKYSVPAGFFENKEKFAQGKTDFLLLSPDGVKIRTGRIEHYPQGTLKFWETVLQREWKRRGYKVLNSRNLKGGTGGKAFYIGVDDGLRQSYYAVALIVNETNLDLVEIVFSDRDTFTKRRAATETFLDGLKY